MTIFIILAIVLFATLSFAPLLVAGDPDVKACVLGKE